jgi:uncharacterized protein YcnI
MGAHPALIIAAVLFAARTASAHVVVEPEQALTDRPQVYTVIVPAERAFSPTVEVTLLVPLTFDILSVEESPGWSFDLSRDMRAGNFRLTWSGGRVSPNRFVRFGFAAQNPRAPTTVVWLATQRYADGTVDEWNDPASEDRTASVTQVVLASKESGGNRTATALGAAAIGVALLALVVALVSSRRRAPPPVGPA